MCGARVALGHARQSVAPGQTPATPPTPRWHPAQPAQKEPRQDHPFAACHDALYVVNRIAGVVHRIDGGCHGTPRRRFFGDVRPTKSSRLPHVRRACTVCFRGVLSPSPSGESSSADGSLGNDRLRRPGSAGGCWPGRPGLPQGQGIDRTATLALIASVEDAFIRAVADPFVNGHAVAGTTHKAKDGDIAETSCCTCGWRPDDSGKPTSPPAHADHHVERPPKHCTVWAQCVENYNAKLLDGKRRRFGGRRGGSGTPLSRTPKSKLYTPLGLGEILSRRTFTPGKAMNPLAQLRATGRQTPAVRWAQRRFWHASITNTKEQAVYAPRPWRDLVTPDFHARQGYEPADAAAGHKRFQRGPGTTPLVASSEPEWTPRSMMAVMDGVDAAKWAFILVGIGTKEDVEQYVEWYKAKARSRPDALQQVHEYWYACAWRIALAMRLGTSFGEVTGDIMADVTAFQEAVLAPASRRKQSGKGGRYNVRNDTAEVSQRPPRKAYKGKSKGKSKGKGKGNAWKKREWDDHANDQRVLAVSMAGPITPMGAGRRRQVG